MPLGKKKSSAADPPPITDAELVIMKVVWSKSAVTANQVVAALGSKTDWKPKTIQTLMARLVQKGVLSFERKGREYVFSPLIGAREFGRAASRTFLSRVFDGEIAPFLATFLEHEKLTPAEIRELRRLLDEKTS